jgi:hypothetical protein
LKLLFALFGSNTSQTAAASVTEDHVENDFHIVHAVTEPDGTTLQDAVHAESLDEKLLIAVRACNREDVKALLKEGATLHKLAKATNLSAEMKTVVGESLAALYSAECDAATGFQAYKGSFMNRVVPIASVTQVQDALVLLHADGSVSIWQPNAGLSSQDKPCSKFKLQQIVMFGSDGTSIVSVCEVPVNELKPNDATAPHAATCSKAGTITLWSKAGVALKALRIPGIDNIQALSILDESHSKFVLIGTCVTSSDIYLYDLIDNIDVTVHTGKNIPQTDVLSMPMCELIMP